MGEHLLAVGDALQLVVGVAEGLGGVAQGLVDLLLAHTLVLGAAAGLGLGADERLVLAAELLAAAAASASAAATASSGSWEEVASL